MYIFIFGLIFGLCLMPLFDSFTSLIITFIEMLKSGMNVKINNNNQKIQQLINNQETTRAIGFSISEGGEEIDYDEDRL